MYTAAEMTRVPAVVASAAQGGPLPVAPRLRWDTIRCEAPVTEAAREEAAVNAGPGEVVLFTEGQHRGRIESGGPLHHKHANGTREPEDVHVDRPRGTFLCMADTPMERESRVTWHA